MNDLALQRHLMQRPESRQDVGRARGNRIVLQSLLALLLIAALGALAWRWDALTYQPIAAVEINGQLSRVTQEQVQAMLLPFLTAGLVQLPIAEVQQKLQQHVWIDSATVARIWPDKLKVTVVEQQPIARWGDEHLLNYRGEQFGPLALDEFTELSLLHGPTGSQFDVMQRYLTLNEMLRPRGLQVVNLRQDSTGAWSAVLANGVSLVFGRRQLSEKIQRFVALYDKKLQPYFARVAQVDMRYHNGLAVAWKSDGAE